MLPAVALGLRSADSALDSVGHCSPLVRPSGGLVAHPVGLGHIRFVPNNVPNNFMSYSVTIRFENETKNEPKYLTNNGFVGVCRSVLRRVKCSIHLDGVQGVASSNPATLYIKDLASQEAKSFSFSVEIAQHFDLVG